MVFQPSFSITSALTADVSRNRNTFVVSTVTAFAYKDRLDSVQRIGRELGVRFVMSGGVQRRGQQILLTAQLADTTNGAEIWNETFSSDNADLPSLQDSVTRRIANSIGLETLKAAARTIESRPKNPSAVDLVLKARAIIYTTPPSQRSTAEAIELYRKAIAIDPAEMQAVVGLAVALAFSADNGFAIDSAQKELQLNESRELALRAKSRVPEDALVFYVLAVYASHHGDFEGARRNDEAALNLEPMSPYRYANLADDYLYAGQTEQAIPLLEQALKLSPRKPSWGVLINIGRAQLMIGQERSAIEWLLKARDATPLTPDASVYLAAAYARLGQMDKSRAAAAEATRIKPSFRLAEFEPPKAGYPAAYRIFWENKLLPACRLAGL